MYFTPEIRNNFKTIINLKKIKLASSDTINFIDTISRNTPYWANRMSPNNSPNKSPTKYLKKKRSLKMMIKVI